MMKLHAYPFIFGALLLLTVAIAAPLHAELSPEVRFDLLKTRLVSAVKADDPIKTLEVIGKLRGLKIKLPSSIDYFEAKSLLATGKAKAAQDAAETYIGRAGRKGKYYAKTLEIIVAAEDITAAEMAKRKTAAKKKQQDQADKLAQKAAEAQAVEAKRVADAEKERQNKIQKEKNKGRKQALTKDVKSKMAKIAAILHEPKQEYDFKKLGVPVYDFDVRIPTTINGQARFYTRTITAYFTFRSLEHVGSEDSNPCAIKMSFDMLKWTGNQKHQKLSGNATVQFDLQDINPKKGGPASKMFDAGSDVNYIKMNSGSRTFKIKNYTGHSSKNYKPKKGAFLHFPATGKRNDVLDFLKSAQKDCHAIEKL